MTWLIACEESGAIRDAMLAIGIDAVSCDLKPTSAPGPHIVGDALEQIKRRWSGVIAHPVCTVLTNAGAKHLYIGGRKINGPYPPRWDDLQKAAAFYNEFKWANAPLVAIENPVMHGHARAMCEDHKRQFVQPWWFGDKAFKATGWHLIGLPKLVATNKLTPPKPGTAEHKEWSFIHRMAPGPDRAELRSKTFPGMASAAAVQWGSYIHSRITGIPRRPVDGIRSDCSTPPACIPSGPGATF